MRIAAVVLAGGTAVRLGGADKASIELDGRTLLEHALAAVAVADEVVVVGDPVPTSRPVTFTREDPPRGGPAAGLLAGVAALAHAPDLLVVLAVDMPRVTAATVGRLLAAATGDGSALLGPDGRTRLALVVRPGPLAAAAPADPHGLPVHRLLAPLDLAAVPAHGEEAHGVDRWEDLRDSGLRHARAIGEPVEVNLHDWIDELCDVLDIETEVDEGLVLDLARTAAHNVTRPAAPVTTYLLGYAAGLADAGPETVERLAARAQALADGWDRPAGAPDPDDVDDEVPDDSGIDHTGESFEDADVGGTA